MRECNQIFRIIIKLNIFCNQIFVLIYFNNPHSPLLMSSQKNLVINHGENVCSATNALYHALPSHSHSNPTISITSTNMQACDAE